MQRIHQFDTTSVPSASRASEGKQIRVLFADDHALVRETIAMFLLAEDIGEVVTVGSFEAALNAADEIGSFDIVLLDYNMPGMNGVKELRRIMEVNDGNPVAIISGSAKHSLVDEFLNAGAAGFIPKTMAPKSMVNAIRFMAAGEKFMPFDLLRNSGAPTTGGLSEPETQVLREVCKGMSNKEIARELNLPEVTVKLRLKNLCRKLDAKNRTEAAMIARNSGLV